MNATSSSRRPRFAVASLCAALALALGPAALAQPQNAAALPAVLATQATRYDAARDEYEIGHFGLAFAAFAQLADEGHCNAARTAQQMVRYGRELYATEFVVTPARLALWRALPGCPVALARR